MGRTRGAERGPRQARKTDARCSAEVRRAREAGMNAADRPRFALSLTRLAQAFGAELNDSQVEIYWDELCGFPIDAVETATRRAICELKFFPKIRELLERIDVPELPDATRAWSLLREALKQYLPGSG